MVQRNRTLMNPFEMRQDEFVQVVGEAITQVEPDVGILNIGVITEAMEIMTAQEENKRDINRVIQALFNYGIKEEDIRTSQYTVLPLYNYIEGERTFGGYEITHMLEVKIEQIEAIGEIMEATIAAGANRQMNVIFQSSQWESYYQDTLNQAAKNARIKAEEIAKSLGYRIDPLPLNMIERSSGDNELYRMEYSREEGIPVQVGMINIDGRVEASFRLKDK